eukprot:4926420-Amphidinium_carterae.1
MHTHAHTHAPTRGPVVSDSGAVNCKACVEQVLEQATQLVLGMLRRTRPWESAEKMAHVLPFSTAFALPLWFGA